MNQMSSCVIYEIEGEVDFFKELKNITHTTSLSLTVEDKPIERCLITDEKLRKDHIVLKCGHKFNYVPLFKEVVFQKCSLLPKNVSSKIVTTYIKNTTPTMTQHVHTSLPTMGGSVNILSSQSNVNTVMYNSSHNLETTKIAYNEIKCPYCRSITPHILPYYPYPDVNKIKYVNSPAEIALPVLTCEYYNNTDTTTTCRTACVYHEKYDMMLCNRHYNKLETKVETENDTSLSTFRTSRRRTGVKSTTDSDDKNVIVSHNNPATSVCSFKLLSGPRKGCLCGKPMWIPKTLGSLNNNDLDVLHANAYCKAHYEKVYPL